MAEIVYVLCAVTSVFCAVLLHRSYRAARSRLFLWSTLAFGALAVNSALLFVDLVVIRSTDLSLLRNGLALAAIALLLIGLLWEEP